MTGYESVNEELLEEGYHLKSDEAITDGQTLPNTVEPIGARSFAASGEEQSQRWAVTPLYTTNHKYALHQRSS